MFARFKDGASSACGGIGVSLIICGCLIFWSQIAQAAGQGGYCYASTGGCGSFQCKSCGFPIICPSFD